MISRFLKSIYQMIHFQRFLTLINFSIFINCTPHSLRWVMLKRGTKPKGIERPIEFWKAVNLYCWNLLSWIHTDQHYISELEGEKDWIKGEHGKKMNIKRIRHFFTIRRKTCKLNLIIFLLQFKNAWILIGL